MKRNLKLSQDHSKDDNNSFSTTNTNDNKILVETLSTLKFAIRRSEIITKLLNNPTQQEEYLSKLSISQLEQLKLCVQYQIKQYKRSIVTRTIPPPKAEEFEAKSTVYILNKLNKHLHLLNKIEISLSGKNEKHLAKYKQDEKFIEYDIIQFTPLLNQRTLITPFHQLLDLAAKDEFLFEMLNLPFNMLKPYLGMQSIEDLFYLIKFIENNIKYKKNAGKKIRYINIQFIIHEFLTMEENILTHLKEFFNTHIVTVPEFSMIQSNAEKYLRLSRRFNLLQRIKRGAKILFRKDRDKYINMYEDHLKFIDQQHGNRLNKSEVIKGKVLDLAFQYFNADGYINKPEIVRERAALLTGIHPTEIASVHAKPDKIGIQFIVIDKTNKLLRFGLTESQLTKYAIIQSDFKERCLKIIAKMGQSIEVLAAQHLMREQHKEQLVAQTQLLENDIVTCTVSKINPNKFLVMVYTHQESIGYELPFVQVEYLAISQVCIQNR